MAAESIWSTTDTTVVIPLGPFRSITIVGRDVEEVLRKLADFGAVAPQLVEAVNVIASAGQATAAKEKPATTKAEASIERPAAKKSAEPGTDEPPQCPCGVGPMQDVRGKRYAKSNKTKAGQPYPHSFYRHADCEEQCDPQGEPSV